MLLEIRFSGSVTHRVETVTPSEWAELNKNIKKIMATQAEVAEGLKAATAQIKKVGTEIDELQASMNKANEKITALEEAIANGEASAAVSSAFAELKTALQTVDDDIPDKPVVPEL